MSTSCESLAIENSTFLQEIADFDIKAPISVTICFEDDFDEKHVAAVETEQKEAPRIGNSARAPFLEPNKAAQIESCDPGTISEQTSESVIVRNNLRDKSETIHDTTFNDTPRKRKHNEIIDDLHTNIQKKDRKDMEDEYNYNKQNPLPILTSDNNEDDKQRDSNSSKNRNIFTNLVDGLSHTRSDPGTSEHSVDVNMLAQNELEKVNSCIRNCLATVSDYMRCIMEAYDFHKHQKTPTESFKEIKLRYFSAAFKIVSVILLPEEKNTGFINTFLIDTVQRARKAAGPDKHVRSYPDYANLLMEILMWTKQMKAAQMKKLKSVTSTAAANSTMSGPELPVLGPQHGNTAINSSNANSNAADKVCLFSTGPPGREFSINIDPVNYLQATGQDLKAEVEKIQKSATNEPQKKECANQLNQVADSLKEFSINYDNNVNRIVQQPAAHTGATQISKLAATRLEQNPELPNPSATIMRNIPSSYNIAAQETNARTPLLQKQLAMPQVPPSFGLSQQLHPQQQKSQRLPPPYGILPHQQAQFDQFRYSKMHLGQHVQTLSQYEQEYLKHTQKVRVPSHSVPSREFEAQLGQNQQRQLQYNRAPLIQNQNTHMQYLQEGYSFSAVDPTQQRNLSGHLQVQQPFAQQQLYHQQRQSERCPSMVAILSQDSSNPPTHVSASEQPQGTPWEHVQPQNIQSKYVTQQNIGSMHYLHQTPDKAIYGQWHSQNPDLQQTQSRLVHRTDWHQELNAIYHVAATPQKGSPRTASTDSGFISPLNFNMSTDQTMPALPQESDTSMPLITHVTSLNEKAAFVEYGNCVVCKKNTKQMCMGCMKIYYCTYQCQSQDWSTHAAFCMQQTTNRRSAQPN